MASASKAVGRHVTRGDTTEHDLALTALRRAIDFYASVTAAQQDEVGSLETIHSHEGRWGIPSAMLDRARSVAGTVRSTLPSRSRPVPTSDEILRSALGALEGHVNSMVYTRTEWYDYHVNDAIMGKFIRDIHVKDLSEFPERFSPIIRELAEYTGGFPSVRYSEWEDFPVGEVPSLNMLASAPSILSVTAEMLKAAVEFLSGGAAARLIEELYTSSYGTGRCEVNLLQGGWNTFTSCVALFNESHVASGDPLTGKTAKTAAVLIKMGKIIVPEGSFIRNEGVERHGEVTFDLVVAIGRTGGAAKPIILDYTDLSDRRMSMKHGSSKKVLASDLIPQQKAFLLSLEAICLINEAGRSPEGLDEACYLVPEILRAIEMITREGAYKRQSVSSQMYHPIDLAVRRTSAKTESHKRGLLG